MTKDGPQHYPLREPRPAPPSSLPIHRTDHFPAGGGDINDKLLLKMKTHSKLEYKQPIFTLDPLNLKPQYGSEQFREVEGLNSPPPPSLQRSLNPGVGKGGATTGARAPVRAGADCPVAQGRAGKEGAGMQGRIYKRRHSVSSLLRSAESAAGTVGEEGGSRKGERQTAVTCAVQEPG